VALHDASTIAAVIVEPMAGSTGVLPPPKGYLQAAARDLRQARHPADLRRGHHRLRPARHAFAAERFGVMPDMMTFAKGITNGAVPMGGVFVRKPIYDAFMTGPDHAIELFHGYTYSGHPLACAAALATLDIYRDDVLLNKRNVGASVSWMGIAWLSPFIGGLLYFALGVNRVKRRAKRLWRAAHAAGRDAGAAYARRPPPPIR
jgi:adenosylmethionine-8-amino-7-oxononanoate aminotransferase